MIWLSQPRDRTVHIAIPLQMPYPGLIPRNHFFPIPLDILWRPPQIHLHYYDLYAGICEFLRKPPDNRHRTDALLYLEVIRRNNIPPFKSNPNYIQNHRILWIKEWLKALPDDTADCSDAETEEFNEEGEPEGVW